MKCGQGEVLLVAKNKYADVSVEDVLKELKTHCPEGVLLLRVLHLHNRILKPSLVAIVSSSTQRVPDKIISSLRRRAERIAIQQKLEYEKNV